MYLVRCVVVPGGSDCKEEPNVGEEEYSKVEAKKVGGKVLRFLQLVMIKEKGKELEGMDVDDGEKVMELRRAYERMQVDPELKRLFKNEGCLKLLQVCDFISIFFLANAL
jgi:hypothetical protein